MIRSIKKELILTVLGITIYLLHPQSAWADSFYSSIGLGIPRYYVSPMSVGMGGAGIGVIERLTVNAMNPAAINVMGITTLSVDFEYESVDSKNSLAAVNTRHGNASGFRFVVPLKRYLNLLTFLKPLAGSRYTLSLKETTESLDYTRIVKGNGGLNAAGIGMQYQIKPWIALGSMINFHFGSYNEEWKTDFVEETFTDASDEFNSYFWGIGFDLGALFKPRPNIGIGMVYKYGGGLDAETQSTLGSGYDLETTTVDISLPSAYGLGISYAFPKLLLALDYFTQSWTKYKVQNAHRDNLNDYWRIGGGLEFLATKDFLAGYYKRISLRLGAYYAELPFTNSDQSSVSEKFLTLGIGLPFHINSGRVDLSLELGTRGQLPQADYRDAIIRFSGSITGSELWFQRSRR